MAHGDGAEADDPGWGESSRYAAHLDRGWSLLDQGNLAAAETSARQAHELRPDDPDAAILLGAIALANQRADESLRWYDKAVELDPDYIEPYASAAQVCLLDLDDPARALHYCSEAIELDDLHPFEALDLNLMGAECEIALGQDAAARQRLQALGEVRLLDWALTMIEPATDERASDEPASASAPADDPNLAAVRAFLEHDPDGEPLDDEERAHQAQRIVHYGLRLARVWMDLRDETTAAALLRRIVDRFPEQADAWHALSEVELWSGDVKMACEAALRTARLDAQNPLPPWIPSPALLHARIVEMLQTCPIDAIRELAEPTVSFTVVVGDAPPTELVLEGLDPRVVVLGLVSRSLHHGPDDGVEGDPTVTGLAVYRANLVRFVRDGDHLEQELRRAVFEELAALLSLPDEARMALGTGRGRPPSKGGGTAEPRRGSSSKGGAG